MAKTSQKILVGMSGGVDSSVAAALLVADGHEVIGAFMRNWSEGGDAECSWRAERRDALRVAGKIGIPFVTLDFEKEYRERVMDEMVREYAAGRTPNPDILCNSQIKFDLFLREAERLGCNAIATGHYARVAGGKLLAGSDENKDQSYFLWAIPPAALTKTLFPIGGMTKPEVREKAHELDFSVAEKADSMGVCFVGEFDMKAFLEERIPREPGDIVATDGKILGRHDGLAFYTIGQRHGMEVGGGEPLYVIGKDQERNALIVGNAFAPELFRYSLSASDANWFHRPKEGQACQARIRYRQELQDCLIKNIDGDAVEIEFKNPQRAVTPGQSVVFYDGEEVLGGAVIN